MSLVYIFGANKVMLAQQYCTQRLRCAINQQRSAHRPFHARLVGQSEIGKDGVNVGALEERQKDLMRAAGDGHTSNAGAPAEAARDQQREKSEDAAYFGVLEEEVVFVS